MTHAPIPLVDLRLAHRRVADDVRAGFDAVLESASFVLGPAVSAFEAEYADYSEVNHCVGVGNGTDASSWPSGVAASGPATRSSSRPTRSSPPPRPSSARAPTVVLADSTTGPPDRPGVGR